MVINFSKILLLLMLAQPAFSGLFSQVNKTNITDIEELELTLIGSNLRSSADALDLSALEKDFVITGRSQSSSIQFINGSRSSRIEWKILLEPKRFGKLLIPSFAIGTEKSSPINISVQAVTQQDLSKQAVFITAKVNNKKPSAQSQIIYTISLYTRAKGSINLRFPFGMEKARFSTLNDSSGLKQTTFQGKNLWVKEYNYAIYPQELGAMVIPKVKQNIRLQEGNTARNIVLFAPAIVLDVQPANKDYPTNKHWLPATQVELSAKFITNPPVFKVGEVVLREITLKVAGQNKEQLPVLPLQNTAAFEQYIDTQKSSEKIGKNTITSQLVEQVIIIANKSGKQILPAIEVIWFDTIAQKTKTAILPAQEITVLKSNITASQISNQPVAQKISKSITAELPKEITPNTQDNKKTVVTKQDHSLTHLFLFLWLATMALCWRRKKIKLVTKNKAQDTKKIEKNLANSVQKSCKQNDAKASKESLNQWLKSTHPEFNNLDIFAKSQQQQDFIAAIANLNQFLHQQNPATNWQGDALLKAFLSLQKSKKIKAKKPKNDVQPLYPNPLRDKVMI